VASVTRRVLNMLATHAVTVHACPAECRTMYELAVHRAGTAAGEYSEASYLWLGGRVSV